MTRGLTGSRSARGAVLIIVLLICLGLVTLVLYFANSMSAELRAADNRVSETAARQALEGGVRYATYVLTNYAQNGTVPNIKTDPTDYKAESLPVGDGLFWFIGRDNDNTSGSSPTDPFFGLVDEASKLNLNTVDATTLQGLPTMTSDLASAIVAWRSTNNSMTGAAADNNYTQLDPPRHNKGAAFETTDELRLVYGATLDVLLGEDTNRNGVLDPNEDDGDTSAPHDDQNGQLLAGILEYVTVYTRLPANGASGQRRINIRDFRLQQNPQAIQTLVRRLTQRGIDSRRAGQIAGRAANQQFNSVMAFMLTTQMTADEFALVHTELTATGNSSGTQDGLINVNTASAAVLGCIPGIGPDNAANVVAYRAANPTALTSFAWLTQVLAQANLRQAGPYITDQSYQFTADIAAVASNGRGYCRERVVFDTSSGTPRIVFRQDLTGFGWALGTTVRRSLRAPKDT